MFLLVGFLGVVVLQINCKNILGTGSACCHPGQIPVNVVHAKALLAHTVPRWKDEIPASILLPTGPFLRRNWWTTEKKIAEKVTRVLRNANTIKYQSYRRTLQGSPGVCECPQVSARWPKAQVFERRVHKRQPCQKEAQSKRHGSVRRFCTLCGRTYFDSSGSSGLSSAMMCTRDHQGKRS